jgi:hypothetical protein
MDLGAIASIEIVISKESIKNLVAGAIVTAFTVFLLVIISKKL